MAGKFDPQEFFRRHDAVAALVQASDIFGLLKRSLDLPPQWAALVRRKSGDHVVVREGEEVSGEGADEVLLVRTTPIDIELNEEGIVTRDQFQCHTRALLRLRLVVERGELLSFQRTILGSHRFVTAADVARYLQPTLRGTVARLAGEHEAADLVDGKAARAASEALSDAAKGPCFAAGFTLDAAPRARFTSPTLRQVRKTQQEEARRIAEHQATRELEQAIERAQGDHLDHLALLLGRLKELAASSPDVALPDLIRTFSEQQRGEVYEALFASEPAAARTGWVVVAAGEELLFFEGQSLAEPARRLRICGAAGAVRSIQTITGESGSPVLLLGAATGVYRLPLDCAEPDVTLLVENAPRVRGGFNAATMVGHRVFASHSELGLCEWNVNQPGSPRFRFESMTRGASAVRGVQFFEGDLYASIDDRIIRWRADSTEDTPANVYTGSEATITTLCRAPDCLFAGNSNGQVLSWSKGRDTEPTRLHSGCGAGLASQPAGPTGRSVESLWLLPSHGVQRLVFTDTSPQVHARVLGDNFTCRYEAGGQTLRRVEVAPDMLIATNDLRDRLIVWTPGNPAKPIATIGIARLTGRSVQDVCLVPEA